MNEMNMIKNTKELVEEIKQGDLVICSNPNHWEDLMIWGRCPKCDRGIEMNGGETRVHNLRVIK